MVPEDNQNDTIIPFVIFNIIGCAAGVYLLIKTDPLTMFIGAGVLGVSLTTPAFLFWLAFIDPFFEKRRKSAGEKAKRKEKPKKVKKTVSLINSDKHTQSQSRHQDNRVSRLKVPDGYVPFEMTRTETKTKDTVSSE